ncbi:hypothetical protein J2Z79_001198 [Symbiobacterium terraclitae]|uniref:Uncharacterized protein n=1 Tax=Symbiobacterium terraclitae TaxID=557451 RepID=A0ABS4JQJ6_9FIRM|nr:hypothetical protein [Symbiobacterium terraclitae]MBP2017813.1 hypothetical protein [Symbiobacterium terraclitae]
MAGSTPRDPGELLRYFPLVRLKEGYRLDSYQYLTGPDGNGFVFAVPADRRLPPPPERPDLAWRQGIIPTPRAAGLPEWAREDIEAFLEPEGSPLSYFQCSLLIRELRELGACWHGAHWSTHEIVTELDPDEAARWQWAGERPEEFLPQVTVTGPGEATVRFYTVTRYVQEELCCHADTYSGGVLVDQTRNTVAVGGMGYIY